MCQKIKSFIVSKKKFLFLFLIVLIFIVSVLFIKRDIIKHKILINLPPHVQAAVQVIHIPERLKQFKNDYNVNFLPNTQFVKLNYNEINLGFKSYKDIDNSYSEAENKISYKIDVYKDFIYAIDSKAHLKKLKLSSDESVIRLIENQDIVQT